MQQKSSKLILTGFFYFVGWFLTTVHSQSVVCRLSRIEGFDQEYSTGKLVCGETTTKMSETRIFITISGDQLYVQSNYLTPGYDFPSKLATSEEINSISEIAMNLFYDEYPSNEKLTQMNSILRNNVEVVIDPKLINSNKYGTINFENMRKLKFLCPDNEVRDAIKIQNQQGGFDFGIKYNNQFSTRIKEQNLNFIFSELRTQKIDFDKVKVLNLIDNTSTKNILSTNFSDKILSFDFSSKENFKSLLISNKGKRTVIIGHIENGDFVTIDKGGKEVFRIPILEIETVQRENKLELILLGCNSAGEGAGSGTINKFNSIDALNRLKATERAENIEEFLDSLSFGTLHFVIDETFFRTEEEIASASENKLPGKIKISVYDKSEGEVNTITNLKSRGSIVILGLGNAEIVTSLTLPSTSDTTQDTISQSKSSTLSTDNNDDKDFKTRNIILFTVIGSGVIGLLGYILKSSNKS